MRKVKAVIPLIMIINITVSYSKKNKEKAIKN